MNEIKVINKLNHIEFSYKDKFYTYEYRTTSRSGFSYIYRGSDMIYGPYKNQCTKEGYDVYNEMRIQNII